MRRDYRLGLFLERDCADFGEGVLTLTPQQARMILIMSRVYEGGIRPGKYTAEDALELIEQLKAAAEGEEI